MKPRKPIPRVRATLRRSELTKAEKEAERERVYVRCGGRCELRDEKGRPLMQGRGHDERIMPRTGDVFSRWHLVHLHSKRPAFWSEAQGNTLLGGCHACHMIGMHQYGMKPVVPVREHTEGKR